MSARTRCAKRVHSGERWDTDGHRCGNYAQPGSDFCHIHGGEAPQDDPRRGALTAAQVTTSQTTTYQATLAWVPGQGPVVRPPYRSVGYGFITRAQAKAVDEQDPRVTVQGVMRKKDGTPGLQTWDADFRAERVLPADVLAQLHAALDEERAR